MEVEQVEMGVDRDALFAGLPPRRQLIYELEELAETKTETWDKDRSRLSVSDLEKIVSNVQEELGVERLDVDLEDEA